MIEDLLVLFGRLSDLSRLFRMFLVLGFLVRLAPRFLVMMVRVRLCLLFGHLLFLANHNGVGRLV